MTQDELHYATIFDAHPDAEDAAESSEFSAWKAEQQDDVRAEIERVLECGTTEQVVKVFSDFKAATGWVKNTSKYEIPYSKVKDARETQALVDSITKNVRDMQEKAKAADETIKRLLRERYINSRRPRIQR